MPLIGEHHTRFWAFSDTNAALVHVSGGGYPGWQAGVITPSLLGLIGAWIDTHLERLQWLWRVGSRLHRLPGESKAVVLIALDALESPHYPHAQAAVRQTATTLGFNRPEAWKDYARELKSDQGRMENVYRHLKACHLLREAASSTLTNPQQNLLAELAYHGFTVTRK